MRCLLVSTDLEAVIGAASLSTSNQGASIESLAISTQSFRFNFVTERDLQEGLALAFADSRVEFTREFRLSATDRPDFFLTRLQVAVEVKTKGSLAQLIAQLARYARHDSVLALMVIGTPPWISRVPVVLLGKPVRTVRLLRSLF